MSRTSAMALAVHPPTNPVPPVTRTRMERFCNGLPPSSSLAHREISLQVAGSEVRGLACHAVYRIRNVRHGAVAVTANRVALGTQLKGLGLI